ncbi:Myc-type, basic helix-loop-helix domain-containing protein [Tanacetum coccineum]
MLEPPPPPAAAATTSGSSNHRRQQQPPAATLQLTAVNQSQLQSTEVNRSQPKSTAVNYSPEVDTDILAYREESPDNVEASFPAWFNYKSKEKGKMNHPCDGRAWKYFDMMKPEFSGDARNVRLGLAADEPTPKPRSFTELEIQLQISKVLKRRPGKHPDIAKKNPKPNREIELNWSKRSIFWDLEYWPFLKLKHNLDVMHIEKNALEALLNTLLQNDKTKDTVKARQDLETLKVRKELWLVKKPNGKLEKPHPKYSFTTEGRKRFCKFIKGVRLPDGFGSNFKQKVTDECRDEINRLAETTTVCLRRNQLNSKCSVRMQTDGRMRELGGTTDVRQAVVWFVLNNSPEVDADILAYREKSPDNIREKKVNDGCSEELFSLACGPISTCTYPACIVNGVKFVVHERDIFHTTQCSGVSTLGLDGEMYYGQLEEILESLISHRKMACVFPRSHGGDAGGSPPRRPNRPVPAQCESSNLRIETGNASLRRAFRQNDQRPLTIGFDYGDLGTFHPTGDYASMLNSLMGETVRYLPLACEWEEIPEAYKAHIFPTLESYFDLASWYNNQDKVVMGNNVYTVGDRVKLGLQLKLRILWRKNKQRIKADHFTRYGSAEEARNHLPPKKVWGDRTEDEWNNLVDWWSHPDRVARSLQNAANRAKNTILTHQGKKSFAQGRNEYKVQKGHYEDLIETWRKTHSRPETGEFKTEKNRNRYLDMKSMQDQVRAGVIPYKTDQDILDEVVPSTNRQNMSGKGRKLPGGGSTSRRRGPQAFPNVISREELDRILRQKDQEAELLRKQTAEAQQRAYLAALKADAAYQNSETMYGAIGEYFSNYAPNPTRPFMPPAFARPTMPQLSPEWAHLLNPPFPYNQPLQPSYAGPSQYTGPPGYTGPPTYTAPLQPLQPPYVGQFPFIASTSNCQPELPRFITNPHNNDTRSVDELARDRELAGEDNDVGDNEEADSQQSSGDYSEDEEGDNEEVQDESEESD